MIRKVAPKGCPAALEPALLPLEGFILRFDWCRVNGQLLLGFNRITERSEGYERVLKSVENEVQRRMGKQDARQQTVYF
jgi:hypothetical protein